MWTSEIPDCVRMSLGGRSCLRGGTIRPPGSGDETRHAVLIVRVGLAELRKKAPLLELAADQDVGRQAKVQGQDTRRHPGCEPDECQAGRVQWMTDPAVQPAHDEVRRC